LGDFRFDKADRATLLLVLTPSATLVSLAAVLSKRCPKISSKLSAIEICTPRTTRIISIVFYHQEAVRPAVRERETFKPTCYTQKYRKVFSACSFISRLAMPS
jgi:hypothetical protein